MSARHASLPRIRDFFACRGSDGMQEERTHESDSQGMRWAPIEDGGSTLEKHQRGSS